MKQVLPAKWQDQLRRAQALGQRAVQKTRDAQAHKDVVEELGEGAKRSLLAGRLQAHPALRLRQIRTTLRTWRHLSPYWPGKKPPATRPRRCLGTYVAKSSLLLQWAVTGAWPQYKDPVLHAWDACLREYERDSVYLGEAARNMSQFTGYDMCVAQSRVRRGQRP